MEHVNGLAEILRREVAGYVGQSPNSTAYFVENREKHLFAVVVVPDVSSQKSTIMVMARLDNGNVVIETDKTNKPLYQALLQAGVAAHRIILHYEGIVEPMVQP
jgi:hypothetical protein